MRRGRARAGFTMIEMMAAIALFALLAAMVGPRIAALTSRDLRREAEELARLIELGRQRAVVTGIPHRIVLDLEGSSYTLEWSPGAQSAEEPEPPPDAGRSGPASIDLSAPMDDVRNYEPLAGQLGDTVLMDDEIVFAGVDTAQGWIEFGVVEIEFESDGTAASALVQLDNEAGRSLTLNVRPLADRVRIREEG